MDPGALYELAFNITPRVAISGVQIVFKIVQGTHTEGLAEDDFKF
jgi:hypothetical protein